MAFSYDNEVILSALKENKIINLPNVPSKIFYIYADLNQNGSISIGYKENKPLYLYHNPILKPASNLLLMDKWVAPSDIFYIPKMTMFDQNNNAIKRLYIGQVSFDSAGKPSYLNNYTCGNSFMQDVSLNANSVFTITNRLGTSNLLMDFYFKQKVAYKEHNNYSLNINSQKENSFGIKYGHNWYANEQEIWLRAFGSSVHYLYAADNADTPTSAPSGYLRLIMQRGF
jgi:hypothetical protein